MRAFILLLLFSIAGFAQEINQFDANGKRHGMWKGYHNESKRLRYEGTFEHGKEVGVFKFYDDTKEGTVIATRDFTIGKAICYTVFYDQKKFKVSEGELKDKKPNGLWKYYHHQSDKIMTLENYSDGKLNGKKIVYYKNGQIAEQDFYTNGKLNGEHFRYAENGNLIENFTYKNGGIEGIAKFYDNNGEILVIGNYKNGQKVGTWETYENGKLKTKESAKAFSWKSFTFDNPDELRYVEDKLKK